MNPADLTINTSALTAKETPAPLNLAQRNGKTPIPRVDLEPIYTQLKGALGDQWAEYKGAVNAFVLGSLNQAELSWVLQPLLTPALPVVTSSTSAPSPISTLHLHNTLLAAIYANTLRDPPPSEVAPWVVATDKPTTSSKNAGASGANDKAEERLKKEVMAIHPRDRRRIKALKETGRPVNEGLADMQDYRHELAVKPPDVAPPSAGAGGITRTNWDIEIRRRYAQTLAEETLEFPTQMDIQNRIEPICYEEGLTGGAAQGGALQQCAEMMEQATEVYLKEFLGSLYAHTRSNGEKCIQTSKYKRQLRKEEDDADRGILQRNAAGLLPVELEVQAKREPLNLEDMRLSLLLQDGYMKQDPFLSQRVMGNRYAEMLPTESGAPKVNGVLAKPHMVNGAGSADAVAVDDPDLNWRGATKAEAEELMGVLDDCLAFG